MTTVEGFGGLFETLYRENPLYAPHAQLAFETLRQIGEGGMGTVYQVRDLRLGREAALKLLSDQSDAAQRERFLREAQITARLDHPSIPPIYEAGMTGNGELYLLMRLIRGETLAEGIRAYHEEGRGTLRGLVGVLVKVCEAVAYAHSEGILHRDLKPENIMVGDFGEVLVMDWGIAKNLTVQEDEDGSLGWSLTPAERQKAGLTLAGAIVGTPGYMAPEQLEGGAIDERADVFALGLLLVEAVTGRRAIKGETGIELLVATVAGDFVGFGDGSLPGELDWVAVQALAYDSERRTESAQLFGDQLKAWLSGELVPGYQYALWSRLQRGIKKRAGLLALLVLGLFSMLVAAGLSLRLERERARAAQLDMEGRLRLESEARKRLEAEVAARAMRRELGTAKANAARARRVVKLLDESRGLLERGAPKEQVAERLEEALALGERSERELLAAGRLYQKLADQERARALFEEVVRRFRPAYEALIQLHRLALSEHGGVFKVTKPLRLLVARGRERGEENEYTLYVEGLEALGRRDSEAALLAFQRIERYSLSFGPMYYSRGLFFHGRGELDKALADYRRCLELDPDEAFCLTNRGLIFKARGQLEAALRDFNRALAVNPRLTNALNGRGSLWQSQKKYDKALADFNAALAVDERYANAWFNRGNLWKKLGKSEKALSDYSMALRYQPGHYGALVNRGLLYRGKGAWELAVKDFQRCLVLKPTHPKAARWRELIGELRRAAKRQ